MEKSRAIVLFSGGQDSTVCLYWAKQIFEEVHPLIINYGQKHDIELDSASHIVVLAELIDFTEFVFFPKIKGGKLLGQESKATGTVADTWVPYRNMLFLTLALNHAVAKDCQAVVIGVNSVDYSGYPDCRKEFIEAFEKTAELASEKEIKVLTPLITLSKKEIVELGTLIPGCMEALAYSHTCYNGVYPPCGECASCKLRAEGFKQAGIEDPLIIGPKNA